MKFEKYHGLGNDFIIIKEQDILGENYNQLALEICERKTGLGADGLIISSEKDGIPWMKFYNSDGTEDTMCGNGIRCFSYFLRTHKIVKKDNFLVYTGSGIKDISVFENNGSFFSVVNMGEASFHPKDVPTTTKDEIYNKIKIIDNKEYRFSALSTGTPHVVVFVEKVSDELAIKLGPLFNDNTIFPEEASINFAEIIDRKNIKILTYERGVGLTLACGTGSCASVVLGVRLGLLDNEVLVAHKLGNLKIEIKESIFMTGPAIRVGYGEYQR
ncbi:MAG: diaminopimelate epimerase [Fusobacteriaceae bacterium]